MPFACNCRGYKPSLWWSLIAAALLFSPVVRAQQEFAPPKIVELSQDHGLALPQEEMTLTFHLKLHDEAAYDKAVEALYTPGSPNYHHWFTPADFAKYAPNPSEVEALRKVLESQGFSVLSVSPDNYSVRVRGTVSIVESAFNTQIHNYEREGQTFHANATPARLTGAAASLISSVSGLSNFAMKPMYKLQVNPKTGKPRPMIPLAQAAGSLPNYFTNNCFKKPHEITLTEAGGSSFPIGQYYGNIYYQSYLTCGWSPAQVQAHYGLAAWEKEGLDGTGETIVIVEGPTDPRIQMDLEGFSTSAGLPAITSSNFEIMYPDGMPSQFELHNVSNWDVEADVDTQWAHAIAPGAKIILLIMPTPDWTELEYAIQFATQNKLGRVISNSYGFPELAWGTYTVQGFESILKAAAAAGVAVNFASGDSGDEGTGAPNGGGDSYPAASAYATSVGGTSIGVPNGKGGIAEVGWGNNSADLSFALGDLFDPPFPLGFQGGSGGGESIFITKPSWQKNLSGSGRQQPDISAFADPATGAIFVVGGYFEVVGGTSVSCPVFSAIWTLADQKAHAALGQAAPLIANLPAGAVNDVVPLGSPTNVAGIVFDSNGATYYSSDYLFAPLFTTTTYFSVIIPNANGGAQDVAYSFGTDTSLTVTNGWDNVTGWGVPNGETFINDAAAAK